MDRRVVGWSAGRHVDHACGWQISPWPARKVTEERNCAKVADNRLQTPKHKTLTLKQAINNLGPEPNYHIGPEPSF